LPGAVTDTTWRPVGAAVEPRKHQMKRLAILTAVASVLFADGASAQYNDEPACIMFEHANFRGRSIGMGSDDSVNFRGGNGGHAMEYGYSPKTRKYHRLVN